MKEEDLQKAKIVIGSRSYPLVVNPQEALRVPEIESFINGKILDIQSKYSNKDIQDCLVMVLLEVLFEQDTKNEISLDNDVIDKLHQINEMVDSAITNS